MTQQATIVAQYVNQPQPGKKQGNIKTPDGQYYGVPVAMLPQFQKGGTYTVSYSSRLWQGKTYRTIETIISAQPPQGGAQSSARAADDVVAERIFVAGGLNNFIAAGKVEPVAGDIATVVGALRDAWAMTFGQKQQGQRAAQNGDMNDEIPF